jgi:hypothetical protein
LTIIESLKDSSSQSFLDVLNGGCFGDGSGFIISSFSSKGLIESGFQTGNKFISRHSIKSFHVAEFIISGNHGVSMMVVMMSSFNR